jgi:hypothetical protein
MRVCLAAGILAVEAYHGGSIRTLLFPQAQQVTVQPPPHASSTCMQPATYTCLAAPCSVQTVFPYGVQVKAIISAISALRASASNASDDLGLFDASGRYIVAPTDSNSVAFSRTTSQVCPGSTACNRLYRQCLTPPTCCATGAVSGVSGRVRLWRFLS